MFNNEYVYNYINKSKYNNKKHISYKNISCIVNI